MLQVLRALRQIKVVDESRVKIELPGDITMTPKQIIDAINQYEAEKSHKTATKFHVSESGVKTPINEAQDTRINEIETRMTTVEDKLNTINNNIADLVAALKSSAMVSKTEE
jgi:beta-mannanase